MKEINKEIQEQYKIEDTRLLEEEEHIKNQEYNPVFDMNATEYQRAFIRSESVIEKVKNQDVLSKRLLISEQTLQKSTWLTEETVPAQETVENSMQEATRTFKLKTLSKSQRTKRGKKFNEKATRQADMLKQMNLYNSARDKAFESVVKGGVYAESQKHKDGENIDDKAVLSDAGNVYKVGSMAVDLSFYSVWKQYTNREKGKENEREFLKDAPDVKYEDILELSDKKTYQDRYTKILKEIDKLDLDKFNYKSDREFTSGFACKMAMLKAFSHADEMLKDKTVSTNKEIAAMRDRLLEKTQAIKDIILDYENRAAMISSPYYVLLAGKDIGNLSVEKLEKKIEDTTDEGAKEYLTTILERKKLITFGKGKSGNKLAQNTKEIKKKLEKGKEYAEKRKEETEIKEKTAKHDFILSSYKDMPEEFPLEEAKTITHYYLEKDRSPEEMETIYRENLVRAKKIGKIIDAENERFSALKSKYTPLTKEKSKDGKVITHELREGWDYLDGLDLTKLKDGQTVEDKQAAFVKAMVELKKNKEKISDEDRRIILEGLEETLQRIEKDLPVEETHKLTSRYDFFKDQATYEKWVRDIKAGFNLGNLLENYKAVGGVLSDERLRKIRAIANPYQLMYYYATTVGRLTTRPEAMFLSDEDKYKMKYEDLFALRDKFKGDATGESEEKQEKERIRSSTLDEIMEVKEREERNLNALIEHNGQQNKENELKNKKLYLPNERSLKETLKVNEDLENEFIDKHYDVIKDKLKRQGTKSLYFKEMKELKFEEPLLSVLKLQFLANQRRQITSLKDADLEDHINKMAKVNPQEYKGNVADALLGLSIQFMKQPTYKTGKRTPEDLNIGPNWKQFANIGNLPTVGNKMAQDRYAKELQQWKEMLSLAKNLKTYIDTSGEDPFGKHPDLKPIYENIQTLVEKTDGLFDALESDDHMLQGRAYTFLQTLNAMNVKNKKEDDVWNMPAIGPTFKEFKEAKTEKDVTKLVNQYMDQLKKGI